MPLSKVEIFFVVLGIALATQTAFAGQIWLEIDIDGPFVADAEWYGDCDLDFCTVSSPCRVTSNLYLNTIYGTQGPCFVHILSADGSMRPTINVTTSSFTLSIETPAYNFGTAQFNLRNGPMTISGATWLSPKPNLTGVATISAFTEESAHFQISNLALTDTSIQLSLVSTNSSCSLHAHAVDFSTTSAIYARALTIAVIEPVMHVDVTLTDCSMNFPTGSVLPYWNFIEINSLVVTPDNSSTAKALLKGCSSPVISGNAVLRSIYPLNVTLEDTNLAIDSDRFIDVFSTPEFCSVQLKNGSHLFPKAGSSLRPRVGPMVIKQFISLHDGSSITGFNVSLSQIEMNDGSAFINCNLQFGPSGSSLRVLNGNARLLIDYYLAGFIDSTAMVVFDDATIEMMSNNSRLEFSPVHRLSNSYYHFPGSANVTSPNGLACTWFAASYMVLSSNTSSTIRTSCDVDLRGIVSGTSGSFFGAIGDNAKITLGPSSIINDLRMDLRQFKRLTVDALDSDGAVQPTVERLSGPRWDLIGGPQQVRISWLGGSVLVPLNSTKYLLYNSTEGGNEGMNTTFPSSVDPGDIYAFDINAYTSEGTTVFSFYLKLDSPMMPVPSGACPPPPPGFQCASNGTWISNGDVDLQTPFVIPAVTVIVNGNFSSSSSVVFQGNGHSLIVKGCVDLKNQEVVVDLTTGTWKTGTVTLIKQNDGCPSALNKVPATVRQPKNSCKKVKAKIDSSSNRSTLNVLFTTDNSACNTKWIILGAVLGSVLIIGIIVTIVVVTIVKSKAHKDSRQRLNNN